ncbi:hypothetical protein X309_00612, partial [Mycobacterium tuberculosis XTB13-089]
AMVDPVVVVANRSAFVQLVLSNVFGQNAPAIAAAEATYEQMWAADVAAMVGYHGGASAAAAALAPWQQAVPGLLGLLDSAQSSAQAVTAQAVGSTVPGPLQGINFGFGNIGSLNLGSGNTGDTNVGSGNIGNTNLGGGNIGSFNLGSGNQGDINLGIGNVGNLNLGSGNEPPRHVRRLQFLERMGSCQVVHRGGTRRSCVSGRCGWSQRSAVSTIRSGQRSVRSPVYLVLAARRRCVSGCARRRSMPAHGPGPRPKNPLS